ncbi:GNAT family N-acetyltransferase [uncultured Catenibacterium sp.]|uniref:GNAT family N-acetyltransferase n=1 Tax=uncultured Catenibacterium sp. TaxID=286142 RepID=UPI0025D9F64C|nr:GNAT family N-acetyltransferase [uncultured Catenibacterium sp.]
MKIYVTYTFLNKEDRDAFYQSIIDNHIQELSSADEGCLKYSYTLVDDTILFLQEEWVSEQLQLKHLKQSHIDILKQLKSQYLCQTTVCHGTACLETERLILREFKIEDADDMYHHWANDEKVTRYLTWPPHQSIEDTKQLLSSWIQSYENGDSYNWGIVVKDKSTLIGNISVTHIDKNTNTVEIGYCIGQAYWGHGYVAEALKEVISYLFKEGYDLVRARHDKNNPRSGQVMIKVGMKYEGTLRKYAKNNQGVVDDVLYSILPEELE